MEQIIKNRPFKSIEDVPVWVKAHAMTLEVYKVTASFPKNEQFGLISQLRRSMSSVPANITEGFYRNSTKELIQFLYNARGSLGESIYHIRLAKDLDFINSIQFQDLNDGLDDIGKQLNGWIKSLKAKLTK